MRLKTLLAPLALLALTAGPSRAANEIQATAPSGRTLYAEVINGQGQVWQDSNTFATITNTSLITQNIPLAEQGTTGIYEGNFPAGITAPGTYLTLVYTRAGASPAVGDLLTGSGSLDWTGTALASVGVVQGAQMTNTATLATINTTASANQTAILNRLGTPVGASLDADLLSIPISIPNLVWAQGTRTLTAQADTPGTATILTNYARRTDTAVLPTTAPAGYGGGSVALPSDFLNPQEQASLVAAAGNTPAGVVAAMKADALLAKTFNRSAGKYTYNVATHVMTLLKDDGLPLLDAGGNPVTLTLTIDPTTSQITGKQ